ncbi:MAG TPA: hypothetical protein VJ698_16615 [Noviherbaspirillum sp.]|uniref:hypothetical protein n=1 Tax=Noviherbaspirillum sp. TaxID=1926288 RepID=UPI002B4A716F|nr:hypothetical protein [Noviherbaspirillum sp.]HJV87089.1 hypothetical protein [Noviherbaspirillum sp.]
MRLRDIGVYFLLMLGTAEAFADPGGFLRDGRETVRAFFTQNTVIEHLDQRADSQPQPDHRQTRGATLQDSSGYSAQNEPNAGANSSLDSGRRQAARLTPEERRALRRQIDEAGHDIYSPKR